MKDNVIKFKRDIESVCENANKKCDEGDYVSALSSLLSEAKKENSSADVCAHIADIYTELGIYENAIYFWYKYLLKSKKKYFCDGFNGLGANYYFSGDKNLAGYYFGEQIKNDNGEPSVYEDVLEDFRDELLNEKPNIYLVKDLTREQIDGKKIDEAKDCNRKGDFIEAIKIIDGIDESSPLYAKALFERAFSYFCLDRNEEALRDMKKSLALGYETAETLSFAMRRFITYDEDSAEGLFDRIANLEANTADEKYKKLTALCEFCLYNKAEELADEILKEEKFDVNTSFVKAFLLYNKGKYKESTKFFQRAYILSFSPIALFYLRKSMQAEEGNVEYKEFQISFNLPNEEIENINAIIKSILEGSKKPSDYTDERLLEVADWCFTLGSDSAKVAMAVIFARSGEEKFINYLKEQLVNPSVSDEVKLRVVSLLCEYTEIPELKVVYEHIFRVIKITRPEFSEENLAIFKKAYAFAFGRISPFEKRRLHLLDIGATELQRELISTGKVNEVKDAPTLACAMYFYSGMGTFKEDSVYALFGVDKNDVVKIIKLTED